MRSKSGRKVQEKETDVQKESERERGKRRQERDILTRAVKRGIQKLLASFHGGCSLNPRYRGKD